MRTLYLSDLDGTLLNERAELSDYAVDALNRMLSKGLDFTVASARTPDSAKHILGRLNLRRPAILMNGAVLYDISADKYIDVRYIYPEASENVLAAARAAGLTVLLYTIENGVQRTYYEPKLETAAIRAFREERRAKYGKIFTPAERLEDIPKNNIVYFAMLDTFERLAPVRDELETLADLSLAFYRNVYTDDLWLLEAFDSSASKESAAHKLRELCGAERVVGFGDNLNDLPLFAACDETYAVSNAREELQVAANGVIGGNTEDGVVLWLEQNWEKRNNT